MNIEDLTIKEAREIAALFVTGQVAGLPVSGSQSPHPMVGRHCVVRTYSDGVHIGTVASVDGMQVLLQNARRVWQWKGAFTLSEVALTGVDASSRLSAAVPEIYLTQAISFTPTTEKARQTYEKCTAEK